MCTHPRFGIRARSCRASRFFPVGAVVLLVFPGTVAAQTTYQDPVELQETDQFGLGARALGMGNAQIAVADDAAAIFFNPAGLAQLRRLEIAAGFSHDSRERTTTHFGQAQVEKDHTRFSHGIAAFPLRPAGGHALTLGLGYHRWADLDDAAGREGLLVEPAPDGLYELESYRRSGTLDAWSAALGFELSPRLSVGGAVRLLTGSSSETLDLANYRARISGNDLVLDLGTPSDPDLRVFRQQVMREADAVGVTGSIGILGRFEPGVRVGATIDLPATLEWEGDSWFQLEDTEKIDGDLGGVPDHFRDDLTLPLSLAGGISYEREWFLIAGGVRWTDYAQIDYEGEILAPSDGSGLLLEPAYRAVTAWHVGAEVTIPNTPLRLRSGFFTEPVPYTLLAADTDFTFVADDGDPNTRDDVSRVARDYPRADPAGDRSFLTLGAGVTMEEGLSLDAAYAWGDWGRQSVPGYQHSTDFYETRPVGETSREGRLFFSASVAFR